MIRYAKETDKETLIDMWNHCFPLDTEHFIRFYFDNVYTNDETLVFAVNDYPVSSMQIITYQIKISDNLFRGGYISGAMTHPDHRRKGYMHQLIQTSFDEMVKKNYDYAFLIPQEKGLANMYSKYGFRLCKPNSNNPKNRVVKTPEQWTNIQQIFFNENTIWLEKEPFTRNEHKGMIKRLNPNVKEISTLYMGMMMD